MDEDTIEGGMTVTKKCVNWKLNNFAQMFIHDNLVRQQKIHFEITDSKGVTSKWMAHLDFKELMEDGAEATKLKSSSPKLYLSLVVGLASISGGGSHVNANLMAEFVGKNGCIFKGDPAFNAKYWVGRNIWWTSKVLKMNSDISHLIMADGTMIIKFHLLLFDSQIVSISETNDEAAMVSVRNNEVIQTISQIENDENHSDVKIISKDGQEFFAYRWMLCGASDVFEAMFRTNMTETDTGVVKFDDLSGSAVKILLHYIYTGEMAPEWANPGNLEEVIYVADKYQISQMKDYLDKRVGNVCTVDNAAALITLAKQTGMNRAVSEILKFVKDNLKDYDSFVGIVNNSIIQQSDSFTDSDFNSKNKRAKYST